jgi:hypothetical protein
LIAGFLAGNQKDIFEAEHGDGRGAEKPATNIVYFPRPSFFGSIHVVLNRQMS